MSLVGRFARGEGHGRGSRDGRPLETFSRLSPSKRQLDAIATITDAKVPPALVEPFTLSSSMQSSCDHQYSMLAGCQPSACRVRRKSSILWQSNRGPYHESSTARLRQTCLAQTWERPAPLASLARCIFPQSRICHPDQYMLNLALRLRPATSSVDLHAAQMVVHTAAPACQPAAPGAC
jgi:hypothetical protein